MVKSHFKSSWKTSNKKVFSLKKLLSLISPSVTVSGGLVMGASLSHQSNAESKGKSRTFVASKSGTV